MNLAAIISVVELLPQLSTLVTQTVQEVEVVFNSLPGAAKFAAAEAKVNTILTEVGTEAGVLSAAVPVLKPLIDAAVAMFNAAGIFKHPAPVAASA